MKTDYSDKFADKKNKNTKKSKEDKEFVKNTVDLNPELKEQKKSTVVFGWGRMNPVTVGHEKLVNKIKSVAKSNSATPVLYLSHSQDPKKNPLSYNDKVALAKKAFGPMVQKSSAKTVIQVLSELSSKYDNAILVVGSDRVKEFDTLIQKYNGKDYNFSSISVVSAGDRDPDSDDISGMSASKMRTLAVSGKPEEFKKGLPRNLQSISDSVYDMVRAGMKLAEELEAEGLLLDEALSLQQRIKRGRVMKRYATKIATARKRAMRRKASTEKLKSRARKKAINIVRNRVAGASSKSYSDMSPGEKIMIDKKIEKRKALINRLAKKLLPKVRKAEMTRLRGGSGKINEEFESLFEDKAKVAQDPDVKDMPGSQPKGYYKGVKPSIKDDRARHFRKYAKKSDDDPASYKPAPGDKGAKTKESEHTKKYRQMYGEEQAPKKKFHQMMKHNGTPKLDKRFKINRKDYQSEDTDPRISRLQDRQRAQKNRLRSSHETEIDRLKTNILRSKTSRRNTQIEEDVDILKLVDEIHESIQLDEKKKMEGLKKKAEKSGISYGILKKVFDRGVAAWRTGHRPGTTPSQWGYARVNSFITKSSGTWGKADKDLAAKVRKEEVELDSFFDLDEATNMRNLKLINKIKKSGVVKTGSMKKEAVEPHPDVVKAYKKTQDAEHNHGEYGTTATKRAVTRTSNTLSKKIKQHHPDLDMKGKIALRTALQNMKEEHGAGFWGTSELADKYAKDTPGQEPMKTHKNKYKEPKANKINETFEDLFKDTEE